MLKEHAFQKLVEMLRTVGSKPAALRSDAELRELEAWACVALPCGHNAFSGAVELLVYEGFAVQSANSNCCTAEPGRWHCGAIDLGDGQLILYAPLIAPFTLGKVREPEFYEIKPQLRGLVDYNS